MSAAGRKIYEELGEGLLMRAATAEDSDALAEFHSKVFMEEKSSGTEAWWIAEWGRDLLTKPHPTLSLDDVIIVEDTGKSRIASSCIYFTQQWTYEGVPFDIGRPEIVGTSPEYRNRGLIRRQFNLMHQWAEERGHEVLVVLGIPYYYRQFGYEMAIDAEGGRSSNMLALPRWGKDEKRAYRMRDATVDDVGFITKTLRDSASRSLLHPLFKEDEVRYMSFDRNERSAVHYRTGILCKSEDDSYGEPVGVIMYALILAIDQAVILRIEMSKPSYWRAAFPSLLREFEERARLAKDDHPDPEREIKTIRLDMQPEHPAFIFDDGALGPASDRQYAWYVRVPDVSKFVRRIKCVLEERVASSYHAGLSGKFEIMFNRDGLVIEFEDGAVQSVKISDSINRHSASAAFHDLIFLRLLFGSRSVDELLQVFPDCKAGSKADKHLLETMFPKRSSDLSLTLT